MPVRQFTHLETGHHTNGSYLRAYYCRVKRWKATTYNSIDLCMFGRHMKKLPEKEEAIYIKQLDDWFANWQAAFCRAGSREKPSNLTSTCHAVAESMDHMQYLRLR